MKVTIIPFTLLAIILGAAALPNQNANPLEKRLKCKKGGINCPHLNSLCSYSYCDENNDCATGINEDCLKQHQIRSLEKRLKCQNGGANCPQLNSICSYSYCDENNQCTSGIDEECLKGYQKR